MYGTLAEARSYHQARGTPGWEDNPVNDAALTQAMVRASFSLDSTYASRFLGARTEGLSQEHEWPRSGSGVQALGIGPAEVPWVVQWAAYEMAALEHTSPGFWNQTFDPLGNIKREKVGPLDTEYFSPEAFSSEGVPRLVSPMVEGLLGPLLKPPVQANLHIGAIFVV